MSCGGGQREGCCLRPGGMGSNDAGALGATLDPLSSQLRPETAVFAPKGRRGVCGASCS